MLRISALRFTVLSLLLLSSASSAQNMPVRKTVRGGMDVSRRGEGGNAGEAPGYWEKQYGMGYPAAVYYQLSLEVTSMDKAEAAVVRILENAGGNILRTNGGPQLAYFNNSGQPPRMRRQLQCHISAGAEAAVKKLFSVGNLQQYNVNRNLPPELRDELRVKISRIEAEMDAGKDKLEGLPIARALLEGTLRRLQQARDAYENVADKAVVNVTLVSDGSEPVPPALQAQQQEGSAKGNLGAIRSALSIYYGDTEGHYPSDLSQLTVNGKYLSRIPTLELPKHKRTEAVLLLRRVRNQQELEAQLKDTGGWAYVSDPDSPLFGSIRIDCTHRDSRGELWHRY